MISVAEYLFKRLQELGIKDVLGVPGDYNLSFVDILYEGNDLTWRGTCNELNASYAADGYARENGFSALITTYGVGELSAMNGIAGAYAEQVPIIHIVGGPALVKQDKKLKIHHSLANGKFDLFAQAYEKITRAQATLDFNNAANEIDRILSIAYKYRYPVYICLPEDVATYEIPAPTQPLKLEYPSSDTNALNNFIANAKEKLTNANKVCVLIGEEVCRYKIEDKVQDFISKFNLPFSVVWGVKGALDEAQPNYIGLYRGQLSSEPVREFVESADVVLSLGINWDEINTAGFTSNILAANHIDLHSVNSSIDGNVVHFVTMFDVINELEAILSPYQGKQLTHEIREIDINLEGDITQIKFVEKLRGFIGENDSVVVDTGTSLFNSGDLDFIGSSKLLLGKLWASIGYACPAALGSSIAKNNKGRTLLLIGDGAFQMTAQALSSMMLHKQKPIIFLINNEGYTIERLFHGPSASYNDIQPWNYHQLTNTFGGDAYSVKVHSMKELVTAMDNINNNPDDKLCFVEVVMEKHDQPKTLLNFVNMLKKK